MSWYLWYPEVLKKYAVFSGRARRKEYWFFFLVNVLIMFALSLTAEVFGGGLIRIVDSLYWLAVLIPSIAVGVRRLHDTGRSGWWLLLVLVPIVGLVLLVFLVLDGQRGPNAYGPDPKGQSLAHEPVPMPPPPAPPSPPRSGPAGDAPGKQPPAQRPPAPPLQVPPAAPDVPSPPPSSGDEEQKPPPPL